MTRSFPAQIYRDSGAYCVSFPDVPGCHTYGESFEAALAHASEALAGFLKTLLIIGQELPKPSTRIDQLGPGDIYAVIACEIDEGAARPG